MKIGDESDDSDDDSTLPPLISEAKMDEMSLGDESDDEHMPIDMLEDICDRIQSYLSINRGEARCKLHDRIKKRRVEWKGVLLSTRNMGIGSHKWFKDF